MGKERTKTGLLCCKGKSSSDNAGWDTSADCNKNHGGSRRRGSPSSGGRGVSEEAPDQWDSRQHMMQMNSMFSDPFGAMGGGGMLSLPGASNRDQQRRRQQQGQNLAVSNSGAFMDPFSHFDSMFSNMRSMMSEMHRSFNDPTSSMMSHPAGQGGQVFQQSSFTTYSNTGNGAPKVYQASSSMRTGPGGVKETRRTVRDSERGIEKISVGHHINERGHVIERSRERGQMNENQEYINLDEEEAPQFDQEYQDKWRSTMRGVDGRRRAERERHGPIAGRQRQQALPSPRQQALPAPQRSRPRNTSHRE